MGRFMLSVAVALAVSAPCGVWAMEKDVTTPPVAHTEVARPQVHKTKKAVVTTPAPMRKKTTTK